MSMTFGRQGSISSEMNVTPMIDVLLVFLIIFMVLFPYQSVGEFADIPQPTANPALSPPPSPIVIQIKQTSEGQRPALKIDQEDIKWDDFVQRLQQISASRPDKTAFLKGDPEVNFQYVADVIDLAHHAGFQRLGLMGSEPITTPN